MARIEFFGGKGGVGKTSCGAAYAKMWANRGRRVLLISTDPAHSTSDLFSVSLADEIVPLEENLWGIEIDPQKESEAYIGSIKKSLSHMMSPIILAEIHRQLDAAAVSPGSHESALFDKMVEIIIEKDEAYDFLIFDTAPTGHTVRLLSLPELLGTWMDSLIAKREKGLRLKQMTARKQRPNDPVLEILSRRKENFEKVRKILLDQGKMSFSFVLNAEKMPIEETKKAVALLRSYKIPVGRVFINKILPSVSADDFWQHKKNQEALYIEKIKREIKVDEYLQIPLFASDMDENSIDQLADYMDAHMPPIQ